MAKRKELNEVERAVYNILMGLLGSCGGKKHTNGNEMVGVSLEEMDKGAITVNAKAELAMQSPGGLGIKPRVMSEAETKMVDEVMNTVMGSSITMESLTRESRVMRGLNI